MLAALVGTRRGWQYGGGPELDKTLCDEEAGVAHGIRLSVGVRGRAILGDATVPPAVAAAAAAAIPTVGGRDAAVGQCKGGGLARDVEVGRVGGVAAVEVGPDPDLTPLEPGAVVRSLVVIPWKEERRREGERVCV